MSPELNVAFKFCGWSLTPRVVLIPLFFLAVIFKVLHIKEKIITVKIIYVNKFII